MLALPIILEMKEPPSSTPPATASSGTALGTAPQPFGTEAPACCNCCCCCCCCCWKPVCCDSSSSSSIRSMPWDAKREPGLPRCPVERRLAMAPSRCAELRAEEAWLPGASRCAASAPETRSRWSLVACSTSRSLSVSTATSFKSWTIRCLSVRSWPSSRPSRSSSVLSMARMALLPLAGSTMEQLRRISARASAQRAATCSSAR
mmetsp:Transcript_75979/g.137117  ORF Transcript_75979/g.137117 Transcript_75979/m.137117 type:complete len:205 (+) Transcript_75979:102-716(+)